jgi:hypothetical protein
MSANNINKCRKQQNKLMSGNSIKGTVSRDFFTLVFFINHLLLVPLDTPRKDFEFFRIFKELFQFVIDSPVYSSSNAKDSKESRLPCV